jgi:hypothetical protein
MNSEPLNQADHDVQALLSVSPRSGPASSAQSVVEFCAARRLSLRSRLEIVEHVCSLVGAAHETGSGFLRISGGTVMVQYAEGGLSIDIPDAIALPGAANNAARERGETGRFSAGQLIRAANVVELGHMLADLAGRVAKLDRRVADLVERATSLRSTARVSSALELRDEVGRLRADWSAMASAANAKVSDAKEESPQLWSWA